MKDRIIEAMARAIVAERGEDPDTTVSQWFGVTDHGGEWRSVGPLWKVEGVPLATAAFTAALEVMKEPDGAVLANGVGYTDFTLPETSGTGAEDYVREMKTAWQAMLAAME